MVPFSRKREKENTKEDLLNFMLPVSRKKKTLKENLLGRISQSQKLYKKTNISLSLCKEENVMHSTRQYLTVY